MNTPKPSAVQPPEPDYDALDIEPISLGDDDIPIIWEDDTDNDRPTLPVIDIKEK